ncbi:MULTISPECIES: hypothetical protein [unclassified Mesorhizobium]|uniref:hypothetical protein n=1 Tax=unclassified Mesorhizobium TaxID=325217 RepID=UPI002415045F|nr:MULTISPECIES: hypothetical protein [unclassified Mesorhizobium]MDG4854082.1 hypothetical protein [Mesorhizobium sp. WSM4982]MDG4910902.1 hypothetical protein [Mesorhizobium sp. WSM4983]
MNAHVLAAAENWQFEVGAWITHKDQSMPSLVLGRMRTSRGDEIYSVRSFAFEDPNRDRMMLGEALRTIDEAAWAVCLLTPELAAELAVA